MKKFLILIFAVCTTHVAFSQKQMPNLSLTSDTNKSFNVKNDFSDKDKLYVFAFWATWCAPCLNELDAINQHYTAWSAELNMELIAVSIDDTRTQKRVKPLLNGKNWTYKILLDTNQDLKRALGIANVPHTIVVKNQKIVYVHNGYSQGAEMELYNILKGL
jgi:peroxiredoxin